jgi:hypothetical protein
MYLQAMAARHQRGIEKAHVGTTNREPERGLRDGVRSVRLTSWGWSRER